MSDESEDELVEQVDESFVPTDDPEEISVEEAATTDIPLAATTTEPEEAGHLTATVCDCCLELNLTHPTSVITCARCGQAFCFHFASTIDAQYCVNCLSDVSVSKSIITKT